MYDKIISWLITSIFVCIWFVSEKNIVFYSCFSDKEPERLKRSTILQILFGDNELTLSLKHQYLVPDRAKKFLFRNMRIWPRIKFRYSLFSSELFDEFIRRWLMPSGIFPLMGEHLQLATLHFDAESAVPPKSKPCNIFPKLEILPGLRNVFKRLHLRPEAIVDNLSPDLSAVVLLQERV